MKATMCDLNVLAFQTDTTRVSTYIGSTPNGVSYPELGFSDMHHSQTHHNNKPEQVAKVAAITAFNIAQFAYMVKKMHSLREGDGTLLDNCIMMRGSGLEDGNKHARENLPFIIAGKGGGSINTGRFLCGYERQPRSPAHHHPRLRGHSARSAGRDRDQADQGDDGQYLKAGMMFEPPTSGPHFFLMELVFGRFAQLRWRRRIETRDATPIVRTSKRRAIQLIRRERK